MSEERDLIIMVDDDPAILRTGKNILSGKYSVATLSSSEKLFNFLENSKPALILLDVMMPGMDGYETIRRLKSKEATKDIPVIFLTGKTDSNNEIEGLNLGAVDYITKPFEPALLLKRIDVHLLVEYQKKILEDHQRRLSEFNINLQRMVEEKTQTVMALQNAIIQTVADLVEYWDNITSSHHDRARRGVAIMVGAIKDREMYRNEVARWDMELILQSSQLHDVGKIAIKDDILKKRGALEKDEFEEIKKHPNFGVQVIDRIKAVAAENDFLNYAKIFAATHHEHWDGSGYPQGLKGEEIPLLGRIMAIADVYDALISERTYKKPFPHDEAVRIIKDGRGSHFDPNLTDIFLEVADQFPELEAKAS